MRKQKGVVFNCFSPPIMLATLLIEFSLAFYAVWRYKMNTATRLIVALLVFLATFQLAEYFVCTGTGGNGVQWSQLGFVAITTLPPLGLHLMHVLAGKTKRTLVYGAYATMAAYIGFFLASGSAFAGHQCTGNYVIFQFSEYVTGTYSIYYFGWLLAGVGLGVKWANELKTGGKKVFKSLQTVRALIVGYLVFLVPTAVANTVNPDTKAGIPSIMCGFAVLLALTLALYILPKVGKLKESNRFNLTKPAK